MTDQISYIKDYKIYLYDRRRENIAILREAEKNLDFRADLPKKGGAEPIFNFRGGAHFFRGGWNPGGHYGGPPPKMI